VTTGAAHRSRLPVVQQAPRRFWRVRADRFLVGFGPPAGRIGNYQMAVLELRHGGEHLVVPGEAVDVDLHDAQIRRRGGEMRIHHRRQMAVEIVRRDVDLERFGGGRDLHRLPHAVPHRVDDRHIHRLLAEIGQELAQAQQCLARADPVRALPAYVAESLRL